MSHAQSILVLVHSKCISLILGGGGGGGLFSCDANYSL